MNSGLDQVGQQVQPELLKSTTFQNGRLTSPKRFTHGNSPRRQGSGARHRSGKCGWDESVVKVVHLPDRVLRAVIMAPFWSGYFHGTYRIGPSPLLALRGAFPKHGLPEPRLSTPAAGSRRTPRVSPCRSGCGNN